MNNTITQLSKKLIGGEVSSTELAKDYLRRAKESDLNAFITIDDEGALRSAAEADKVIKSGKAMPLTGIPFGIKDAITTKGLRTTAGSKILDNYIPPFSATVIEKLRAQGAVIIGKNNMDEFAMGSSTENSAYGPTLNPHDKSRVPGGSSGGSAASVAADLCTASLGSDTGGSIRQPAAFCGVVGFKPTYGRVSRYGLIAMASSLDQIGPIAKTAQDAKVIYDAISGYDHRDATSIRENARSTKDITQLRVGVVKEHIESQYLAEGVRESIKKSIVDLEKIGCKIEEVNLPSIELALAIYYIIMPVEVSSNLGRFDGIKYGKSVLSESNIDNLNEVYFGTRSKHFGAEVKRRIILGAYASSAGYFDKYYARAKAAQQAIQSEFNHIFEKVDVLVGPTTPTTAFKIGEKSADPIQMYLSDVFTVPANIAGLPAISMPIDNSDGLPVGLQILGNKDADDTVLDLAVVLENK